MTLYLIFDLRNIDGFQILGFFMGSHGIFMLFLWERLLEITEVDLSNLIYFVIAGIYLLHFSGSLFKLVRGCVGRDHYLFMNADFF